MYLGDFLADKTVRFEFTTNSGTGGAVAPSDPFEAADLKIYKDGASFSPNGVTMTSPFDTTTGLHAVAIDTSNDGGDNWVTGADYSVVLSPDETVDGQTVVRVVASFSIQNRYMRGTDSANTTTPPTVNEIRDGILNDATTFSGASIDAAISSRGTANAGDLMGLSNSAITSAKYDGSTAFPVKFADSGASQIARVGADEDTLETISNQIDVAQTDLDTLTDNRGEPAQGAPPASAWLGLKIDYIYKFLRNLKKTTSTQISVYNDAGNVVDHKSTISDDGTIYTENEFESGP